VYTHTPGTHTHERAHTHAIHTQTHTHTHTHTHTPGGLNCVPPPWPWVRRCSKSSCALFLSSRAGSECESGSASPDCLTESECESGRDSHRRIFRCPPYWKESITRCPPYSHSRITRCPPYLKESGSASPD